MLRLNKLSLKLSILMLCLHPVAHAELYGKSKENSQLQQLQQLQTQLKGANGRITALETVKNNAAQNIRIWLK